MKFTVAALSASCAALLALAEAKTYTGKSGVLQSVTVGSGGGGVGGMPQLASSTTMPPGG